MRMPIAPPAKRTGVHLYVQVRIANNVQPMLVPLMMQHVPVADRTFLFKRYARCFTGTDAVTFFLTRRFARSEAEAVAIGNALLRAGVFRHVRNEHLFTNGNYFYRFAAHEDYAAGDDNVTLRSSRMMSVACASFVSIPEIQRIDTAPVLNASDAGGDATFFSFEDSLLHESRPEFSQQDVVVETGIRIGKRVFPDLVSSFSDADGLVGEHVIGGRKVPRTFTGRGACKWLVRHNYAGTIDEAVGIGNAMLASGVFYPLDGSGDGSGDSAQGFTCTHARCYRMMADTDLSQELRRGARKDMFLKLLGINRAKNSAAKSAQQSPWFEEQMSFSFTSDHSGGGGGRSGTR